jgi:hypothetical protein
VTWASARDDESAWKNGIDRKLGDLERRVHRVIASSVRFRAVGTGSFGAGSDQYVRCAWGHALLNLGAAYRPEESRFFAPAAGYYDFSIGLQYGAMTGVTTSHRVVLAIAINETLEREIARYFTQPAWSNDGLIGGEAIDVFMNKGDFLEVWIHQNTGVGIDVGGGLADRNFLVGRLAQVA